MTNKTGNQSKLSRCIRAPIRFLGKVRNSYVRFMYRCADMAGHGDDMGLPPSYYSSVQIRTFPSSDAKDLGNLFRANSKSNTLTIKSELLKKVELEILQLRQQRQCQAMAPQVQKKKCCEVIETIDEENPCEFSDDLKLKTDFPRQKTTRSASPQRIDVIV